MGGGFILSGGLTPPSTPPRSPRLNSESPQMGETIICELILNNQPIELSPNLSRQVSSAVAKLCLDPENAKTLNKELLLDANLLIGLINETKIRLQQKNPRLFADKYKGNDRIEQAFVENKKLSATEKEWVEETIFNYKQLVKSMVSQNTPRPITPPPSIVSLPPVGGCLCRLL